jgi:hypothetical protein
MLGAIGVLSEAEVEAIVTGLAGIGQDLETGRLAIDPRPKISICLLRPSRTPDRRSWKKAAHRAQPQ